MSSGRSHRNSQQRTVSASPRPQPSDRPYWLAWPQIEGIGPHRLKTLFAHFGSLKTAWHTQADELLTVSGIGSKLADTICRGRNRLDRLSEPAPSSQLVGDRPVTVLTPADAAYPGMVWELPDPPPVLFVLGDNLCWSPAVSIVGTRSPTEYGRRWTQRLSRGLAEAGFTVVSGMALGIDGIAHQAALDVGGTTLAVLGTGVDRVYPPRHRSMHRAIQEGGALVSEFPIGTEPAKENFPRRNRIVAGLCQATIVIEAPARSGALITARLAADYNRDVFALPGTLDTPEAQGCLRLIRDGATPILGVADLLEALGCLDSSDRVEPVPAPGNRSSTTPPVPPLDGDRQTIWHALPDCEAISVDILAQRTGLSAATLTSTLLMMELAGTVEQVPGMRYCKASLYRNGAF